MWITADWCCGLRKDNNWDTLNQISCILRLKIQLIVYDFLANYGAWVEYLKCGIKKKNPNKIRENNKISFKKPYQTE